MKNLCYCPIGISFGWVLKMYVTLEEHEHIYLGFPGELLLRMLQMVTVPLIVTSVIIGKTQGCFTHC